LAVLDSHGSDSKPSVNKRIKAQKAAKSTTGSSGFVEAFPPNTYGQKRPAGLVDRLGENFRTPPRPDPYNPGGGGGPKSVVASVSSDQSNANSPTNEPQDEVKKINERTVHEKFEAKPVKRLTNRALKNQRGKLEYQRIKNRLEKGALPTDLGSKSTHLGGNHYIIKGLHIRCVVAVHGDEIHILGLGARGNDQNMKTFQELMNETYGLTITGY
jgi:hypothetical protein